MSYIALFEPKSLQKLAAERMDKVVQMHMPICWSWDETTVGNWIEFCLELPYRKSFEKNNITGKKLINLEARHLPLMNITDWNHIQYITLNIRHMFSQQLERYHRPISQPWPNLLEQYWKIRAEKNLRYEKFKFSDFLITENLLKASTKRMCHINVMSKDKTNIKMGKLGRIMCVEDDRWTDSGKLKRQSKK
ncbi:hypothetical protein WDU94_014603 [Cyamophila willieti]